MKDYGHGPLVSGTGVLKAKGHNGIVEIPNGGLEGSLGCLLRRHPNLVVAAKAIHK